MRVAMISKALVVATYRSKICELRALGAEVAAVVPPSWKEGRSHIQLETHGLAETPVTITPIRFNGHFHLHYYRHLAKILTALRPDIVHVDEEPYNLATFLAVRAALACRARPLFFTWQNIAKRYPPPFGLMQRYVFGHCRYGLAGTPRVLTVLREQGYFGPARVIPQFGVDTSVFGPSPRRDATFTVGFLGRLVPEKGVSDLIAAFRRLKAESRLVIAGEGPLGPVLRERNADLIQQGRLELLPRTPSPAVPDLLRRLHVLVLPSHTTPSWQEQFGRVLIEAMSAGVPVIGSNSGEIPWVIGGAGIVYPEGDIDQLASALRRLSGAPSLALDLSKRGRQRVIELFSQKSVASNTYEVYEELMSMDGP